MARPRRKSPPLTVSRPTLLRRGSDAQFRQLIHDLIAYGHRLDACRDAFAAIIGVSGVQYEILMLASRAEGLSVGEVAARLHRSGAFITIEANKLVQRGILDKAAIRATAAGSCSRRTPRRSSSWSASRLTRDGSTTCCSNASTPSASPSCSASRATSSPAATAQWRCSSF